MFEGSEHHDKGFPAAAGRRRVNGSTNADRTGYWEVVPSNALELALWMESDRMGYLLPALTDARSSESARCRAERTAPELRAVPRARADGDARGAVSGGPPYHWTTIGDDDSTRRRSTKSVSSSAPTTIRRTRRWPLPATSTRDAGPGWRCSADRRRTGWRRIR